MTCFVRWSARIYRAALVFYPFDLRNEFGAEMVGVFSEDLADASRNRGLSGALWVWWRAVAELLQIGLPARVSNQAFVAPAISLAVHLAVMGGLLALVTLAQEGIPHGIAHGFITLRGQ